MKIIVITFAHHLLTDAPVFIQAKKIINHYLIGSNKISLIADIRDDTDSLLLYKAITGQVAAESNKLSVRLIAGNRDLEKDTTDIQTLTTDLKDQISYGQKKGADTVMIMVKHNEFVPLKKIIVQASDDPSDDGSGFHFKKLF